jgi:hypothetical protein
MRGSGVKCHAGQSGGALVSTQGKGSRHAALERCGQRFLRLPIRSLSQPDGLAEELPQGLRIRSVTGVFFP